jgi:3-oxoacyl-[acyl-carrier-protein] synthase II
MAAFSRMTALSSRNDDPKHASRPFDIDRDGFVMGEAASALILESWDHAVARGAHIYGEIAGYGRNADAYHITAPSPGGGGAAACMQLALDDAGLNAGDIAHVNAHGTSTPLNDAAEAEAIRKVFGDAPPPTTSTKGVTGHLIGAAGATEAVACLLAIKNGQVPPTANLEHQGDDIRLDIVAGSPRDVAPGPALSNSFGFGGHNASLILIPAP